MRRVHLLALAMVAAVLTFALLASAGPNRASKNRTGHYVSPTPFVVPWSATTDVETDTGYDLPSEGVITDCVVVVDTAEYVDGGAVAVDIGLLSGESGGDADGLFDGIDVSSTGFVAGSLASGGQTRGALLRDDESGAGVLVPGHHVLNGTAKSVSVTASLLSFDTAAGRLICNVVQDPTDHN